MSSSLLGAFGFRDGESHHSQHRSNNFNLARPLRFFHFCIVAAKWAAFSLDLSPPMDKPVEKCPCAPQSGG
ncbi:MAG TPA: hypothetical protein VF627_03485 [Abditibacterium sp.]